MLSRGARMSGPDCNVTNDCIQWFYNWKRCLTTIDGSQNQDHFRPTTKLNKGSVSVYAAVVQVGIGLLLFQFQVLNLFVKVYFHVIFKILIWF